MRLMAAMSVICLMLAARAAFADHDAKSTGLQQTGQGAAHPLMPPSPYYRPPDWLSGLDPEARRMWERVMSFIKLRLGETRGWQWLLTMRFESLDSGPTAAQDEKALWLLCMLGDRNAQRDINYLNRALIVGSLEIRRKDGLGLRLGLAPPTNGIWYGGLTLQVPLK